MNWKDIIAYILTVMGVICFILSGVIYYVFDDIFHFATFLGFGCIVLSVFIFLRKELFIGDEKKDKT